MDLSDKVRILFPTDELKSVIFLFLGMIPMALLEVAGVASIAPFMATISNPEIIHTNIYLKSVYSFFGCLNNESFFIILGSFVVFMLVISNGYTSFMFWRITYFSNMYGYRLSKRLLKQYLDKPYVFFLTRNTADLGKNILTEVDRVVNGVILNLLYIFSKLGVVLLMFLFLFLVDTFTAIIIGLVLGGVYWIIFVAIKNWLQRIGVASTQAASDRYKTANEAMSGIKELKIRGGEEVFIDRFSIPSKIAAACSAQNALISVLPRYALEVVAFSGVVAFIVTSISLGSENIDTVIPLVSLYVLAGYRLMPSLQSIYANLTHVRYFMPAMDILLADLCPVRESEGGVDVTEVELISFERDVELRSVSFSYPSVDKKVLDKCNIQIEHNTTVGFVGLTGAGKSTLIDILLGLLSPQSGEMYVDGIEINGKNISSWQKNLSYVPQSIYILDDSIIHNIAFAVPDVDIDLDRVIKVAKLAALDDFIYSLPEGYQTVVGERGTRLSGGQRQRIGLARALYSSPNMLVLDEATSSLDGLTESMVMDAIRNISHKMTIVMIAHRLTTLTECDVIYVMSNGSIVDSGTYVELMMNNIQFQKMAKE